MPSGVRLGGPSSGVDSSAAEGLRLTDFNVEVQCTPSRSALMTGRYAIRSGNGTVPLGEGVYGLVQWEVTMAEMLSEAGYATGMYGKWHLGRTNGRFPTDQGFDEWCGVPNSTDEAVYSSLPGFAESGVAETFVMDGTKGDSPKKVRPYRLDYRPLIDRDLTDRAKSFMRQQATAGRPFFVYLPYTASHFPTLPHPDFEERSGSGLWADLSMQIDSYVGELLDTIDERRTRSSSSPPPTGPRPSISMAPRSRSRRRCTAPRAPGEEPCSRASKAPCGSPSPSDGRVGSRPGGRTRCRRDGHAGGPRCSA